MTHTVNAEVVFEDWYIEERRDAYEAEKFAYYREMGQTPEMEDRYGPIFSPVKRCDCGNNIPQDAHECQECAREWSESMSDGAMLKYPGYYM